MPTILEYIIRTMIGVYVIVIAVYAYRIYKIIKEK